MKINFKFLIEKINLFLNKKTNNEDEKSIKCLLLFYFQEYNINHKLFEIHLIETVTTDDKITVKIMLSRPGVFIGRAGEDIDKIETFLSEKMGKTVIIELIEFNPWKY